MTMRRERRIVASPDRIRATIRVGQECGLTPDGVSHYPDGRTVVHFGAINAEVSTGTHKKPTGKGWKV